MENSNDSFGFFEDNKIENLKLDHAPPLMEKLRALEGELRELKKPVADVEAQIDEIEQRLIEILEANKMKKLETPSGLIERKESYQVNLPQTIEEQEAYFNYWIDNNMKYMLSVNSNTLKSYYNKKVKALEDAGETPDFDNIVPGVKKPSIRVTLSFTKGK